MVDAKLVLESATTAFTNARIGTNVLDLGSWVAAGKQPGAGTPMFIKVYVDTAFSSDTETVQIDLVSDSSVPTAADTVMTVLMPTAVNSIAGLHAAGQIACMSLPSTGLSRYIALSFVIPTAVASGKIFAFLDYSNN